MIKFIRFSTFTSIKYLFFYIHYTGYLMLIVRLSVVATLSYTDSRASPLRFLTEYKVIFELFLKVSGKVKTNRSPFAIIVNILFLFYRIDVYLHGSVKQG